jgi:superfamily I DNA/RNA helicase
VIYGAAGTGKTVLAIERARRLAGEGHRVLLTCYNRPLGDHLALELEEHEGTITAKSFHALGLWLVASSGAEVPDNPDTAWFETRLPELLPGAAKNLGFEVDAVVVDEGQDFHSEWFLALQLLCADADTAPFYVFTDPNQTIYNGSWEPPFTEPAFDLDINCRNTNQIAAKVSAILGQSGPTLGVDGPEPSFVTVPTDDDRIPTVIEILKNMLSLEGLRPEQLTVLSRRRATADDLRGSTVGGHLLDKPGGKGIAVDTVHRFKGLESDVVVATMPELANDNDKRLAYIALSRAKSFLVVVGTEAVKAQLAW